ncbi:MAG: hypothetical protein LBJ97_04355 [Mycoplasmataceae bacterium]|nr:hypothetical protein [Mycoplasmataceae bacterium]
MGSITAIGLASVGLSMSLTNCSSIETISIETINSWEVRLRPWVVNITEAYEQIFNNRYVWNTDLDNFTNESSKQGTGSTYTIKINAIDNTNDRDVLLKFSISYSYTQETFYFPSYFTVQQYGRTTSDVEFFDPFYTHILVLCNIK